MKTKLDNTTETQYDAKLPVSRSAKAWMVLAKTQPKVYCANYPIYWRKDIADKEAEKFGGTVARCEVRW